MHSWVVAYDWPRKGRGGWMLNALRYDQRRCGRGWRDCNRGWWDYNGRRRDHWLTALNSRRRGNPSMVFNWTYSPLRNSMFPCSDSVVKVWITLVAVAGKPINLIQCWIPNWLDLTKQKPKKGADQVRNTPVRRPLNTQYAANFWFAGGGYGLLWINSSSTSAWFSSKPVSEIGTNESRHESSSASLAKYNKY
jgi:hypothetical protein